MEAVLSERNLRDMVKEMASVHPMGSEVLLPKVKLLVNTDLLQLLKKLGQIRFPSVFLPSAAFPF